MFLILILAVIKKVSISQVSCQHCMDLRKLAEGLDARCPTSQLLLW